MRLACGCQTQHGRNVVLCRKAVRLGERGAYRLLDEHLTGRPPMPRPDPSRAQRIAAALADVMASNARLRAIGAEALRGKGAP